MEAFSRPGIGVGAEAPKSAASRVLAPVPGAGASFDTLFQAAAADKPATQTAPPSAGTPLAQFPLKTTTTAQLIYSLTGRMPAPAALPEASPSPAPLPPALTRPSGLFTAGAAAQPGSAFVGTGVHRMDDLRVKMQRMKVPQSTLDIRVTQTNSHEVKRVPGQKALGRVTGAAVSKRLAEFRGGTLSWGELEHYGQAAAAHTDRVIARLAARDAFHRTDRNAAVVEALDTRAEALRQLASGARALDNGTVDAAEMVALESDVSLQQARTAARG